MRRLTQCGLFHSTRENPAAVKDVDIDLLAEATGKSPAVPGITTAVAKLK